MVTIKYSREYFSIEDTLFCGQIFRFEPYKEGYKVFAEDKCCYAYNSGEFAYVECEEEDEEFFYNFFDLERDYSQIYNSAINSGYDIIVKSAKAGKGIRILNQNPIEMLFSFMISQNNNIPRIKNSINAICSFLGDEKSYNGEKYYAFPTVDRLKNQSVDFYKRVGLGYRAEYFLSLAKNLNDRIIDINSIKNLSTKELKKELMKIYGVGEKVADCVLLFGFRRTDSFPVDTWIDKVYREDFLGTEKNRHKITDFLLGKFKENSGYFQQYLFYYKRSKEKGEI